MAQRSVTTNIPVELYDAYIAAKPDDATVGGHMRSLIRAFVDKPGADEMIVHGIGPQMLEVAMVEAGNQTFTMGGPVYDPDRPLEEQVSDTIVLADPETCLHPHGTLVRDGHFVRCTLCNQIIR